MASCRMCSASHDISIILILLHKDYITIFEFSAIYFWHRNTGCRRSLRSSFTNLTPKVVIGMKTFVLTILCSVKFKLEILRDVYTRIMNK